MAQYRLTGSGVRAIAKNPRLQTSTLWPALTQQLCLWAKDSRHRIVIPCWPAKTAFRQRVLDRIWKIPAGQTLSYGALARQLKSGARAIGQACRHNHLPVIIACHRVVGADGQGGYMGQAYAPEDEGSWLKTYLLGPRSWLKLSVEGDDLLDLLNLVGNP